MATDSSFPVMSTLLLVLRNWKLHLTKLSIYCTNAFHWFSFQNSSQNFAPFFDTLKNLQQTFQFSIFCRLTARQGCNVTNNNVCVISPTVGLRFLFYFTGVFGLKQANSFIKCVHHPMDVLYTMYFHAVCTVHHITKC